MQKRIAILFLLLIYAVSSSGIGINRFYCCGKLKSVHFVLLHEQGTKCIKGNGKKGCCETTYHTLKLKENHVVSETPSLEAKYFITVPILIPTIEISWSSLQPQDFANACHAPPPLNNISLYILHCTYRI